VPQGLQGSYYVVHTNVLKRIGVLGNVIINAIPFRVGQVVNGTPLRGVLLRNNPNRMALEVRQRGGRKRPRDPSQRDLLVMVSRDHLGVLGGRD